MFTPLAIYAKQAAAAGGWTPPASPVIYIDPAIAPSGTTILDQSGNGNNGTAVNLTYQTTGIKRYTFNGTNGYADFGDSAGDPYDNLTAIVWAYADFTSDTRVFVNKFDNTGNNRQWSLINEGSVGLIGSKNGEWFPNNAYGQSGVSPSANWRMYSLRYNYTTGIWTINISAASPSGFDDTTFTDTWDVPETNVGIYDGVARLLWGAQDDGTSQIRYFDGDMGHLFVYNTYLSDTDMTDIFDNTKTYYGL